MGRTSWPACQEPLCFCLLITRCYWGVWAGQRAKSPCISHTKRNELAAGSSRLQRCVPVLSGARPESPTAISALKSDAAAASWTEACCLTFLLAWSLPMHLVTQAPSFLIGKGVRMTLCHIVLYCIVLYCINCIYSILLVTLYYITSCYVLLWSHFPNLEVSILPPCFALCRCPSSL